MSKSEVPTFDAAMFEAYNYVSESHRHERGPWTIMTNCVISAISGIAEPRILDIASGRGEPAKSIAVALPHSKVIATDFSQDKVLAAKEYTSGLCNVDCLEADAQDLSQFESNSFDVVTCCYGYMFPPDKAAAISETLRVLKPGGTLIATTWDRLDMLSISNDVMREVLGCDPPPPTRSPMSLSEEGLFRSMLHNAGLVDIEQTTSTYPLDMSSDKKLQFTIGTMIVQEKLKELAEEDVELWNKAETAFWSHIGKYTISQADNSMIFPENTYRLTVGTKA